MAKKSNILLDNNNTIWLWLHNQYICHESGCHSLQLHITHGLHLPSCTAHTLSRPPLHQSHSCHHSLINSDCLTTPAPHSLTHIKAAHKHSPSAKSCFPLANILSVSPVFLFPVLPIYSDRLLPALLTLPACWYLLCLLPAPTLHCPCCWFCLAFTTPVTTFDHCLSDHLLSINKAAIGSNYTASSLQKTSPPQIQRLYFGYPAQPWSWPTPTSSPGRPVYWGVCPPVLGAVVSGTVVRRIFVQRLVLFRAQWTQQIPVGQISVSWWGV